MADILCDNRLIDRIPSLLNHLVKMKKNIALIRSYNFRVALTSSKTARRDTSTTQKRSEHSSLLEAKWCSHE